MYIFALLPHSRTSRSNQIVPWHIVFFGKWFNTHRLFNWKWETSLNYDKNTKCLSFHAYWLKKGKNFENSYFYKRWFFNWRKRK